MNLKLATLEDVDTVVKMVKVFVDQTPYRNEEFDPEKVRAVVVNLVRDRNRGIVIMLMKDDLPIGFLGGTLTEMIFSRKTVAAELFWWVDPQYRTRKSLMLKEAFEFWGKRVGASYTQMSAIPDPKVERFYERSGYTFSEKAYMKAVGA